MAQILLVDDDLQLLRAARTALERAGHEVVSAVNGEAAVRRFRQSPPDLLITDIVMPEKEGLETILELRRESPNLKILAISAYVRSEYADYLQFARQVGANGTLAKPFDRDDLLAAVNELLET